MTLPVELFIFILGFFIALTGGILGVVISLIKRMFGGLETKITGFCNQNKKDHDMMWRTIHTHGHTCCDEKNPKVYTVE